MVSLVYREVRMPEFEVVPLDQARLKTANGRQGKIVKQYSGYIEQLVEGQAGRLLMAEGEIVTTVRRRLVTTAETILIW
jgi:ABC-type dipeptide/oligopeptide/nickel transport system permease component